MFASGIFRTNSHAVFSARYCVLRSIGSSQSTTAAFQSNRKAKTSDSTSGKKIVIPKKVKRDELSILKALASTVKADYNAPRHLYIDDPFLAPTSTHDKKTFALAHASGQRAARYVINKFPQNFAYDPSDPKIESLQPPKGLVHADDTLEGLQERIDQWLPLQAYESYNKVVDKGVEVPVKMTEDVLDLLCYYNSEDKPDPLLAQELYFWRDTDSSAGKKRERSKNTWKGSGPAETLFSQIKEPSVAMYSAMIRGRCKYLDTVNAYDLFNQARDKGIQFPVETYNDLLKIGSYLSDSAEARWLEIKNILADMASCKIKPDVETFNSAMYALSRSNRSRNSQVRQWAMSLMNEMRNLKIEPTLSTWFHLLKCFYFDHDANSNLLREVVDHLKGKEFQFTSPTDYEFFSFSMIKCCENVKDMEVAHKLNDLLNVGDNMKLLGDHFKEAMYHTHYLRLMSAFEQVNVLMEYYEKIVPHIYSPTFGVLENVLNAIELNEAFQYLPRIYNDIMLLRYTRRADLWDLFVSVMVKAKSSKEPELRKIFAEMSDSIMKLNEADSQDTRLFNPLVLSGSTMGNIISIQLWSDNSERAWEILEFYLNNKNKISGFPSEEALVSLTEVYIRQKDIEKIQTILALMSDLGYPKLDSLIEQTKTSLTLSDDNRFGCGSVLTGRKEINHSEEAGESNIKIYLGRILKNDLNRLRS